MSESNLVNAMKANEPSFTEKGAKAHSSTMNHLLDLFYHIGTRNLDVTAILSEFLSAFREDPRAALRILLWSRDIRSGSGQRRNFTFIMKHLIADRTATPKIEEVLKLRDIFRDLGYWKDLVNIYEDIPDTKATAKELLVNIAVAELQEEVENSLIAKWLPRKGSLFNAIWKKMKLTPGQLRKILVAETVVVERLMCENEWDKINYKHVPSIASSRYAKAFAKHSPERYQEYLDRVNTGKETMHAGAIYPHQILMNLGNLADQADAQWKNLPDYMEENSERILPVVDTSGSMTINYDGLPPIYPAVALGLYISERNKSIFQDAFVTFSGTPQMQYVKANRLQDRFYQMSRADWGGTTNITGVFELLLNSAKKAQVSPEEMPTQILILSDMQFDQCARYPDKTLYESFREHYLEAGYALPKIVFWNLRSADNMNVPARADALNVALVSGFSPTLMVNLLKGKDFTPLGIMQDVTSEEKYGKYFWG